MEVNATLQNDWLLYYYNECDMHDSDRIQRGLDGDPLKAADYQELVETLDGLTLGFLQPSDETVNRILAMA